MKIMFLGAFNLIATCSCVVPFYPSVHTHTCQHPIRQHFPMLLSLEAIFMSVCIVKLSILIHVVGFLCLLVIYILILFDMVILFNMKTFKKHTNKCAILGTSLAGNIQQLLNSSDEC